MSGRTLRFLVFACALLAAAIGFGPSADAALPLKSGSVKFCVIGDAGTGAREQHAVAAEMVRRRATFPFTFVPMLGDNIYGPERPQDFNRKFTRPYKALLDAGVEFYAALGNHDDPNQRYFKPFNLDGKRYHSFKKGNVRFFALDSNYMDPEQVKWLERGLKGSTAEWKIAFFHHPLYTTARRGPEIELRRVLEPIFVAGKLDVVLAGHEHIYERFKPQKGIHHYTVGGAAKLRRGDTKPGPLTAATFDTDRSFMLVEIAGKEMHFQTISRAGQVVDEGVIQRGR